MWSARTYTVAQAAAKSGLSRGAIDVIIHRAKDVEMLFSEKAANGRRYFSLRDIAVLRIAYELERAGRTWLLAIGKAYDHLQTQPDADAVMVAPVLTHGCGPVRIIRDHDVPRLAVDKSLTLIPIGAICAGIAGPRPA